MTAERLARVALSRITEPGAAPVAEAVAELGAEEVWAHLRAGRPVGPCSADAARGAQGRAVGYDPADDLARLAAVGGRLVCPGDDEWPAARLHWPAEGAALPPPPLALYLRGPARLDVVGDRSVAVVGARTATAYGAHVAREWAFHIASRGWSVVSGGAFGIDAAAHRGALDAAEAPTCAVLACGVDVLYPRGNTALLQRVAREGLLVSELPPGCSPTRGRFLVRNRLIAGLSRGTLVVEAASRSGSLSTLARAHKLHRHEMVVPGAVTSTMSAGCNERLREPGAHCVTRPQEVLELLGPVGEHLAEPREKARSPRDDLAEHARKVLDAVPVRRSAGEASIARTAGVPPLVVQQVLPPLLAHGLVERTPEGWRLTALGAGRPAQSRTG